MLAQTVWESSLLNWTPTGRDEAPVGPDNVLDLLNASSPQAATDAYWRLDGLVVANGVAYAAALPATQLILAGLPGCTEVARARCLELLGQIVAANSSDTAPGVVEACTVELQHASWYLLYGLQFDQVTYTWLYVDLVAAVAEAQPGFRPRALQYLRRALTRALPDRDVDVVHDTIQSLERS